MSDFKIEFNYDKYSLLVYLFIWNFKPSKDFTYRSVTINFLCFRIIYPVKP